MNLDLPVIQLPPGISEAPSPLRVQLDASRLGELILSARDAHRVYELATICRPGDLWELIDVALLELPRWLSDFLTRDQPAALGRARVRFDEFDRSLGGGTEDVYPGEEEWANFRSSELPSQYVRRLFEVVQQEQARLAASEDPLIAHVARTARDLTHPYCWFTRSRITAYEAAVAPNEPAHSPTFYEKLRELLTSPDVGAVAYHAYGDYTVLRLMATEQRRRVQSSSDNLAYPLSAMVDETRRFDPRAWDARIVYYDEGIGRSDLFIDGGGLGPSRLGRIMAVPRYAAQRFILAAQDHGEIASYRRDHEADYCLYVRE